MSLWLYLLFTISFLFIASFFQSPIFAQCQANDRNQGLISASLGITGNTIFGNLEQGGQGVCITNTAEASYREFKVPTFDNLLMQFYTLSRSSAKKTTPLLTTTLNFSGDGIYSQNTDMVVNSAAGSGVQIIFVQGNLDITGNINYADADSNSGLVFIVSGDIHIDSTVSKVNAVLISSGIICTAYLRSELICIPQGSAITPQLTINGSLISLNKTDLSSGAIQFRRMLSVNNVPAEIINKQAKYLYILRGLFTQNLIVRGEDEKYDISESEQYTLPTPSNDPSQPPSSNFNPDTGGTLVTDLRSYWKLDDTSGNAADSLNNNPLTPFQTVAYQQDGKVNKSVGMSGVSGGFRCSDAACGGMSKLDPDPAKGFSYSFWINPQAYPPQSAILGKYIGNATSYVVLMNPSGALRVEMGNSNCNNISNIGYQNITAPLNTWTHITVTAPPTTGNNPVALKIYKNGALAYTSSSVAYYCNTAGSFGLGTVNDNTNYANFNIRMDEVGIWAKELTLQNITDLYNNDQGNTYNPIVPSPSPNPSPTSNPQDVTGLVLWLDANNGASVVTSGNRVSQWSDLSGSNRHFGVPMTPEIPGWEEQTCTDENGNPCGSVWHPPVPPAPINTARPWVVQNGLNGKTIIHFNSNPYNTLVNSTNFTPPVTIIYLARQTGGANQRVLSGKNNNWLLGFWGGRYQQAFFNGWVHGNGAGPLSNTSWHIHTAQQIGSVSSIYENGNLIASNSNGVAGPNGLSLNGHLAGSEFSDADIAEVIIYNKSLSTSERQQIEDYLRSKWGLTNSTPSPSPSPSPISSQGLVAHWKMEEANWNGQGVIIDSSSTGINGTRGGNATTTAPGIVDSRAGLFDGTGDYFTAPDNSAVELGNSDFTISTWINPTAQPTSEPGFGNTIYAKDSGTSAFSPLALLWRDTDKNIHAWMTTANGSWNLMNDTNLGGVSQLTLNTWHNIVFIRSGGVCKLYIDGTVTSNTANGVNCNGSLLDNTNTHYIGGQFQSNGVNSLNGKMDDYRIYKRALSTTEISQLYNQSISSNPSPTPPPPPPPPPEEPNNNNDPNNNGS